VSYKGNFYSKDQTHGRRQEQELGAKSNQRHNQDQGHNQHQGQIKINGTINIKGKSQRKSGGLRGPRHTGRSQLTAGLLRYCGQQ
jgi:hypothetical protein